MADTEALERRIEQLFGEVNALETLVGVLIRNHPHRSALLAAFRTSVEQTVGVSAPKTVPEAFLDGLQQAADRLESHIKA